MQLSQPPYAFGSGGWRLLTLAHKTMKIKTAILSCFELACLWLSLWLLRYAVLAMNNWASTQDVRLPVVCEWFVFLTRHGLMFLFGIGISVLIVHQILRSRSWSPTAIAVGVLILLTVSAVPLASFPMLIGGCLCDEWKQWDHPLHGGCKSRDADPTFSGNTTNADHEAISDGQQRDPSNPHSPSAQGSDGR